MDLFQEAEEAAKLHKKLLWDICARILVIVRNLDRSPSKSLTGSGK